MKYYNNNNRSASKGYKIHFNLRNYITSSKENVAYIKLFRLNQKFP